MLCPRYNWYEYAADNVKTYAPNSGGVYILTYREQDKHIAFYVGKATDLEKQLLGHLSPTESDPCVKAYLNKHGGYFSFIEIDSEEERNKIEQEQIFRLDPRCNV